MKIRDITTIQWFGIIILFNTTLLGGSSQLGDLLLSAAVVKAILALATLGNGFLGGLVTMFGGQNAQIDNVKVMPQAQEAMVKAVLDMPGIENVSVNRQASAKLAAIAVDPANDKIAPIPADTARVEATARTAA